MDPTAPSFQLISVQIGDMSAFEVVYTRVYTERTGFEKSNVRTGASNNSNPKLSTQLNRVVFITSLNSFEAAFDFYVMYFTLANRQTI